MTTYAELTQQIIDYTETDSNVLTTTILNDIIEHAESRIFRNADLDVFKKYKTANLTIGDPFVAMPGATPQLFAFVRYIQIFGTDNIRITLEKKDASFINEYVPNRTTTGTPKYYAPSPDATYTVELAYNAQPTGLSSSNTTTWVSNNAPEMLLYACLVEAFKFLKNPQMVQMYEAYYKQALQPFVGEQMGRRRRDEYMDGIPRITIPSENP